MAVVIQTLGFEVVEPLSNGLGSRPLSRRYSVRGAADVFCDLLREQGHPEAYVRAVAGTEGPRGGKRFMRRVGNL